VITTTNASYKLGWERIFGKKFPRGNLYLLPSEAASVIVQYSPDFRISCLIPPKQRQIAVDWQGSQTNWKINSPYLLLSQLVYINTTYDKYYLANDLGVSIECDCPDCTKANKKLDTVNHPPVCECEICKKIQNRRLKKIYYLYAVDEKETQKLVAQPYRLANVYEDGKICFRKRGGAIRLPQNLREAHSTFWTHRFDNDFNWKIPHDCTKRYHEFRRCVKNRKKRHKCPKMGSFHHRDHKCQKKGFDYDKDTCECCMNICECWKKCPCCAGGCRCAVSWHFRCNCNCCQNICNCPCKCDLTKPLAKMLEKYIPSKAWEDHTSLICGEGFVSTSKKFMGVFISCNSYLLNDIPKQYWLNYTYKANKSEQNRALIVGFARLTSNNLWKIQVGDFEFSLSQKQINIIS
jgi:hypothetical protein